MTKFLLMLLCCASVCLGQDYFSLLTLADKPVSVTTPWSGLTGLVAYWSLDETNGTRSDGIGTNHFSQSGGVGYAAGVVGNSAYFVSNSLQYLSAVNSSDLSMEVKSFTFICWIQFFQTNVFQRFMGKFEASGKREFLLSHSTTLTLNFYTNGIAGIPLASTISPTTNAWHMICFRVSTNVNEIHLSIDNADRRTNTLTVLGGYTGTSSLNIGGCLTLNNYFDGLFDEIGFWNRALTDAEITTVYNSNQAGIKITDIAGP